MILWITGNSGSGKTTLSRKLAKLIPDSVIIDGDDFRKKTKNRDMSKNGRYLNCLEIGREAYRISVEEKKSVIIAAIAPYRTLRESLTELYNIEFVYLLDRGKKPGKTYPYELPMNYA
jgi:adenylylsulfate kinase-like enzyme